MRGEYSVAFIILILALVGYGTAGPNSIVYSVQAGISNSSILSIRSSLQDRCMCQLEGGQDVLLFSCADGDDLSPPCGTYTLSLSCTPNEFPAYVAKLSLRFTVSCTTSQPQNRTQLRCSLTVADDMATLKCSRSDNRDARLFCRLDRGSRTDYSNAFSTSGLKMANLPCGDHQLKCDVQSKGSTLSTPIKTLNFTVSRKPSLSLNAKMAARDSKATLLLSTVTAFNCTCMLDSQNSAICQNGTMFSNLAIGPHAVKLNCCRAEDDCSSGVCAQESIQFHTCPSDPFTANVTISGSDVTLFFNQHPLAVYKCSLYNSTAGDLIKEIINCSSHEVFEGLFQGRYNVEVVCQFPSASICDRSTTISDIIIVTPEPAIISINGRSSNTSVVIDFTANCKADYSLCQVNGSEYQLCASPFVVDLVSRPFGNYEVEVFVVCQGVESTPTKLIFEYKSGNRPTEEPCSGNLNLVITGNSVKVILAVKSSTNIQCRVNEEEYMTCHNGSMFEDLPVGDHLFEAVVNCSDGNVLNIERAFTIEENPCKDASVRNLSVVGPQNNILKFFFIADKNVETTCSFNGTSAEPCISPFDVDISSACSGQYQFLLTGFCDGVQVVRSAGTIRINRNADPSSCPKPQPTPRIAFSCSTNRKKNNKQLQVTCSVRSIPTEAKCYVEIIGRPLKRLPRVAATTYKGTFKNTASVSSLRVKCDNVFTSHSKTLHVG